MPASSLIFSPADVQGKQAGTSSSSEGLMTSSSVVDGHTRPEQCVPCGSLHPATFGIFYVAS